MGVGAPPVKGRSKYPFWVNALILFLTDRASLEQNLLPPHRLLAERHQLRHDLLLEAF